MALIDTKNDESFTNENINDIINSISEDIILNNIINQIHNCLDDKTIESKTSLFNYFEERYNFIISTHSDNDEIIKKVIESFNVVLEAVLKEIQNVFKFNIFFDEGIDFDLKITLVKSLYEFFIVYLKDNVESLIFNLIDSNMTSFKKICKVKNKKDLTYVNLKKVINNEYTSTIFCIETIIESLDIDNNDDTIKFMIKDDPSLFSNYYTNKIFSDEFFSNISFNENLFNIIKPKVINDFSLILKVKERLINKYNNFN